VVVVVHYARMVIPKGVCASGNVVSQQGLKVYTIKNITSESFWLDSWKKNILLNKEFIYIIVTLERKISSPQLFFTIKQK